MTDASVEVVFDAPFVLEPSEGKPKAELTAGGPGDHAAWKLPLYPYPKALSDSLRNVLPKCVAARDVGPGLEDHRPPPNVVFRPEAGSFQAHMTLWKPDVLLVTQRVRLSLPDDASQYKQLTKIARSYATPLGAFASVTCGQLGFVAEPLWVTATAFRERQAPAGTPRPRVGALDVRFHELVTVASHPDPSLADKERRKHRRQFRVLMAVQQVLWAAAVDLDRSLLTRLTTMKADVATGLLRDVEQELAALVGVSHRITTLRARHASTEGHLGRETAAAFWDSMEQHWKLRDYLKALGEKISGLYHLHSEIAAAVNARRARRLGRTAFAFTALGVVTVGLAAVGYATTNLTKVPAAPAAGWGLLVLFVIVAFLVFVVGLREEMLAWRSFGPRGRGRDAPDAREADDQI